MATVTTRLTLWYSSILGFLIITIGVVMYVLYENQLRASVDAELERYADILISGMDSEFTDISGMFNELITRPETHFKAHRFIVSSSDSIIFEAGIDLNLDSLFMVKEEDIVQGAQYMTFESAGKEYRAYSREIPQGVNDYYQLAIITPMERLHRSLADLRGLLLLILPASLILAGGGGWFIARRALRPVHEMTQTAREITCTNLSKRVPVGRSKDELAELATTFNEMIDRLDETFKSQKQFITDASHDLRTPLTVIQLELEQLLVRSGNDAISKEVIGRGLLEVQRLSDLASDLLFLARVDAHQVELRRESVRVDELAMECVSQLKSLAASSQVMFDIQVDDPVEMTADPGLLRRALINVIDNALRHSPASGTVHVQVERGAGQVTITITDYGNGIPPDELTNIFDRFHSADRSRTSKGSGLGLAIAKAVVESHQGTIGVTSSAENGTTFRIQCPTT